MPRQQLEFSQYDEPEVVLVVMRMKRTGMVQWFKVQPRVGEVRTDNARGGLDVTFELRGCPAIATGAEFPTADVMNSDVDLAGL